VTFSDATAGTPAPVTGVRVGAEFDDLLELDATRQRYRHRILEVPTSAGVDPKRPDRFTINGAQGVEAWTVHERLGVEAGYARVRVIRPERVEAGGRRAVR
jgi:hypothetical protein